VVKASALPLGGRWFDPSSASFQRRNPAVTLTHIINTILKVRITSSFSGYTKTVLYEEVGKLTYVYRLTTCKYYLHCALVNDDVISSDISRNVTTAVEAFIVVVF